LTRKTRQKSRMRQSCAESLEGRMHGARGKSSVSHLLSGPFQGGAILEQVPSLHPRLSARDDKVSAWYSQCVCVINVRDLPLVDWSGSRLWPEDYSQRAAPRHPPGSAAPSDAHRSSDVCIDDGAGRDHRGRTCSPTTGKARKQPKGKVVEPNFDRSSGARQGE